MPETATTSTATEVRRTTCPMDCPDACALEVRVEEGRVVAIDGSRDHPDTAGFICGKVARFHRRLEHPDRLLFPQRRVGGRKGAARFERITWEEAIAEITGRFREIAEGWGAEAILPFHYGGSNGSLTDELLDTVYFAGLGASRLEKTICAVPATRVATGMYGKMPGVAFADFPEARCIVVWGANPKGSNIHLVPYLREARRRGAFVVTVDPRRCFSEAEVDLHLPVLPGQDLPLALSLIALWEEAGQLDREFLERHADGLQVLLARAREWPVERAARVAGVEAAAIRRLAQVLAESAPAVVRCGWGLERNANGGQAVAAVLAIPALLGKFGVRGGGYTLSNNGGARFDRAALLGALDWSARQLNMTQLGRILAGKRPVSAARDEAEEELDPPVKGLFVYNANPAVTVPDQAKVLRGLAREDLFTVVHEQVLTDTARFADILLPAATFLEGTDLRVGYGSYVVGGVVPVVEPAGEAWTNLRLFTALGRAWGIEHPAFDWSEEEILERAARAIDMPGGSPAPEVLAAGRQQRYDFPGGAPVQLETVRPRTLDGRIDLAPAVLGPEPYGWQAPAGGYPLALVTPASSRLITSTLGESNLDVLAVSVHPDEARARGLDSGDPVRVFNDLGEVVCRLRVTEAVRPGVASMPKGAWRRSSLNGATSTALCPDAPQVVGDAACFNDARVEIAAAP